MEKTLTEVFVFVDDFCQVFEPEWRRRLIASKAKTRMRRNEICLSELMTILIFFHLSGFKSLKKFYFSLLKNNKKEFPKLVSYQRFVELQQQCAVPLLVFFNCVSASCDGNSFIDSTALPICHIKREKINKVFAGLAKKSKSTMGWFFGFKLHLITNTFAHPISFTVTKGNVDDRKVPKEIFSKIYGKLFGDKGYIGKDFFNDMKDKMVHVITALRSNMKPQIMLQTDSQKLNKRSVIESVFNVLKNNLTLQHTRHRSPRNFIINIFGCMCAYCLRFFQKFTLNEIVCS